MITTQGYGVGVMPQLSQPNPAALSGFNPQQVTGGALDALNVASTLDQIKAFRQHQEEFVKLEQTRAKMIKAQVDIETYKAEHAARTKESEIGRINSENDALSALFPQRAEVESGQLHNQLSMLPGRGRLDLLNLASQLNQQPFKNAADEENAKTEAALAPIVGAAKIESAPMQAKAMVQKATEAWLQALDDVTHFPENQDRKDRLDEAKIALEQAQAAAQNANATFTLKRPDIEQSKIQDKNNARSLDIKAHETIRNSLRDNETEADRLGRVQVSNPFNPKMQIPVSELASKVSIDPNTQQPVATEPGKIYGTNSKPVSGETWNSIRRWLNSHQRVNSLKEDLDLLTQQIQGQTHATIAPPAAIQYLKENPTLTKEFDAMYGEGSAAKVLGK